MYPEWEGRRKQLQPPGAEVNRTVNDGLLLLPEYWRQHVLKGKPRNTGSLLGGRWWRSTGRPRGTGRAKSGDGEARSTDEAG